MRWFGFGIGFGFDPESLLVNDQPRDEMGRWTASQHADHLKSLMDRAMDVVTTRQGSEADIHAPEEHVDHMTGLSPGDLAHVASSIGVDKPGKSKAKLLAQIRDKASETRRAWDSIQV